MCLVAFALNQHPDYPLILVANRDEFFERPTQNLHWWHDHPRILGGRDLEAGGSWLAVNQSGRWAAVTNFRNPDLPRGQCSRGQLVLDCLTSKLPLKGWFESLAIRSELYSGFNFMAGDVNENSCYYFSNQERSIHSLTPGTYALSNGFFSEDWPKMKKLREQLSQAVLAQTLHSEQLLLLLTQPLRFPSNDLPKTGIKKTLEQKLASPFIKSFLLNGETYGTRSSAIMKLSLTGSSTFFEQSHLSGESQSKQFALDSINSK